MKAAHYFGLAWKLFLWAADFPLVVALVIPGGEERSVYMDMQKWIVSLSLGFWPTYGIFNGLFLMKQFNKLIVAALW